ncbi:MAG: DnaJ domain-containing protein [Planctomycetota bacterium]
MNLWPSKSKSRDSSSHVQREAERFEPTSVRCGLGEVVDMSGAGMRLRSSKKPPVISGQVLLLELVCDGAKLGVKAQVRWWRRVNLGRYELGLKFVRLTREASATLEAVARDGRVPSMKPAKKASAPRSVTQISVATDLPNYYRVLGVRPDADAEAIRRRYRQLAVRLHPDVNTDPDAQQRFEQLCEAYNVLSDEKRREAYTSLIAA